MAKIIITIIILVNIEITYFHDYLTRLLIDFWKHAFSELVFLTVDFL